MKPRQVAGYLITRRTFVARSVLVPMAALLSATRPVRAGQASKQVPPVRNPALIDDLVAANRILAQHAIVDGFGHASVRHDRNPNRYFLSRSLAPELVTADDIVEFDLESVPVDAKGRSPYSERFIHGEIYRARPEVNAIVHCHAASLIPFGVGTVPLRPVYHMAAFLGEGVPVFDIRDAGGITDMLVSDRDRGRALARALGNRAVVLMRGHGAVIVGSSVPIAVGRSIYLDMNARVQAQAIALGGPITYLDPGEARNILAAGENGGYQRPWELWKQEAGSR
jgi:HCOMODA/2-hydroxy-3-carboxy-muconic semialdehyde decarboxylase